MEPGQTKGLQSHRCSVSLHYPSKMRVLILLSENDTLSLLLTCTNRSKLVAELILAAISITLCKRKMLTVSSLLALSNLSN